MMRKLWLLLVLALVIPASAWARSADDIVSEFRDEKHAQYVNVGPGMLSLARMFTLGIPGVNQGISAIRALDLSDCSGGVRDKFRKRVKDLRNDYTYEEMVTSRKDDDQSLVLLHNDGQYVDELVILTVSDDDNAIVVIKGRISIEDVERIANDDRYYPIR